MYMQQTTSSSVLCATCTSTLVSVPDSRGRESGTETTSTHSYYTVLYYDLIHHDFTDARARARTMTDVT